MTECYWYCIFGTVIGFAGGWWLRSLNTVNRALKNIIAEEREARKKLHAK